MLKLYWLELAAAATIQVVICGVSKFVADTTHIPHSGVPLATVLALCMWFVFKDVNSRVNVDELAEAQVSRDMLSMRLTGVGMGIIIFELLKIMAAVR
ncbi:MAG: hypothetical protein JWM56_152 [Candidatus Peribacteria bacterium]|nr:hypothetical protein [Candidatus Peribacteria bacterium]